MADRYEIKGRLGRGGIGAVYAAYDHHLGRDVAIKRLLPIEQTRLNESADKTLEAEAKALAALSHPNIVTIYEFGEDDQGPFVVFELIEGDTIKEVIEEGALSEQDFYEVADQILDALIAAHKMDILHRDIKPANVMLTWLASGRFQIKMLDFGLAKFAEEPSLQTLDQAGSFLGSIDYVAPEQIELFPLDQRTDLYSLGCLLYFSLTQRAPFSGESMAETMSNHLAHNVTPLEQVRPDIPIAVCRWVMKLIEQDPDNRPNSALEAMEWLNHAKETANSSITDSIPTAKLVVPVMTTAHPIMTPIQLEDTQQIISAPPPSARPVPRHPAHPKKKVVSRYQPPRKEEPNRKLIYTLVASTVVLVGICWAMIASARNDRERSERLATVAAETPKNVISKPVETSSPATLPVNGSFGTGVNVTAQRHTHTNSFSPHGLPQLPLANRLVAYYSIGGSLQNRQGGRYSLRTAHSQTLGAMENHARGVHQFHLIKTVDDVNRVPAIESNWKGEKTLMCDPGEKLLSAHNGLKQKSIVSNQYTFAVLGRIPNQGAVGAIFRAEFSDSAGKKLQRPLRLSYFPGTVQLSSGYSKAKVNSKIESARYEVYIVEYDGSKSEMTFWKAGKEPGQLVKNGSLKVSLSGPLRLNYYEVGSIVIPRDRTKRKKIEAPAMSIHTALLSEEDKQELATRLYEGAFPQ